MIDYTTLARGDSTVSPRASAITSLKLKLLGSLAKARARERINNVPLSAAMCKKPSAVVA